MLPTYTGTLLSESTHSSRSPISTEEISRYGSQTVKPRPSRSMAARLIGVYAGSLELAGERSRNVNARPAERNLNFLNNLIYNYG